MSTETELTPSQKALNVALAITGSGVLTATTFGVPEAYRAYAKSGANQTSLVFDVNALRLAQGKSPVIFTGSFIEPLKSNKIEVTVKDAEGNDKVVTRIPTYDDRTLTAAAESKIVELGEDMVTSQDVFLAVSVGATGDGVERPSYTMVIASADADKPIVVPLDLWIYADKSKNLEFQLNGFSGFANGKNWSNRVRLNANSINPNNGNQSIGYVLNAFEFEGGNILPSSTTATFASRQAHVESRRSARTAGTTGVVRPVVPVSQAVPGETADPFKEYEQVR